MTCTKSNVHVGDVGTRYKARILANDEPYDPTMADEMTIIFTLPEGDNVERDAFLTTEGTGDKQKWFLNYDVELADITDGLHAEPGVYQWQGYLHFPDDTEYHTNIDTYLVKDILD